MLQLRKSSHVVTLCCLHMLWLCAVFACCDSVLSSHVVTLCCLRMWLCAVFACCDSVLSSHVVTVCSLHMLWLYTFSSSVSLCGPDFMHSSLFPNSSLKILQLMWSLFSTVLWSFDGSGHQLTRFCIGFYISSKCFLSTSCIILKLSMSSPQLFTAFEGCMSELHFHEHFLESRIFLQLFSWVWNKRKQNMTGETNSACI
jgi:hypothetical protein